VVTEPQAVLSMVRSYLTPTQPVIPAIKATVIRKMLSLAR